MRKKYSKTLLLLLFVISLTSSCKEIRNLLKAIDKYGYKSKIPLGEKDLPIDKLIIGSYVYNNMPIIISEKDEYTYNLKFLATELDAEDINIEAFLSVVGKSKYINLVLGYSYSFLKISDVSIVRNVEVSLVKNTIKPYVGEKDLKNWLLKHDGADEFLTPDSIDIDIFYKFNFYRITEERAFEIKAEQLKYEKNELFKSCKDYETYTKLSLKYNGDPDLLIAREALFNKCISIEDYKAFVDFFTNDALSEKANKIITEKTQFIRDSLAFQNLRKDDDISTYLIFIENSNTQIYKDSALNMLIPLLNNISEDKIKWKWDAAENTEAVKLIFYKIEYTSEYLNINWYREFLTLYCLLTQQADLKEKALYYLDKLAMECTTKNEFLDMYISKGFLLWSLGRIDEAMNVFKSKINEAYQDKNKITFKKNIFSTHKAYQKAGIQFPDEKVVLKRIKKL